MQISLFEYQSTPRPRKSGSLRSPPPFQEALPIMNQNLLRVGAQTAPQKRALTQSAASVAGLSQPLCPSELSHTGAPCTPARPRHLAYLCPRLGSSSLALPQPGLRYRAGSPAACAEVPSSSSSRSSTSSASWMATRICTVVSGPGRVWSLIWAMTGRVPALRGRASRAAAVATIARGRCARRCDSAPGRDWGRDPAHAAPRAPP